MHYWGLHVQSPSHLVLYCSTLTVEGKIINSIDQKLLENTDPILSNILFGDAFIYRASNTQILNGTFEYILSMMKYEELPF